MIVERNRSLFIVSSFKSFAEIHRQAQKLLSIAERLQLSRRFDALAEIVSQLEKLPLTRNQEIVTQFFRASCLYRRSQSPQAIKMLERVAAAAPLRFRARAFLGLGVMKVNSGDIKTGNQFYDEALKISRYIKSFDPVRLHALKNKASILGMNGDNIESLRLLKSLASSASIIRINDPVMYYDYLNSMAVELTQSRDFDEARFYIDQALASPFASNYPEWRETKRELEESRRGCRHRAQISYSGRNNIAIEAFQVSFAKISLPAKYLNTPIDRMSSYRVNRTWPSSAPDENGSLLNITGFKHTKEAEMKKKSTDQKLTVSEKQTLLIERLARSNLGPKKVESLLALVSPTEKLHVLMETILSRSITEETLDQISAELDKEVSKLS